MIYVTTLKSHRILFWPYPKQISTSMWTYEVCCMHWSKQFWGSTSYLRAWPLGTGEVLIQIHWITPKGTHNSHCSVHWTPCVIQRELSTMSLFLFHFYCRFWYLATFIYTIWWQRWCWTEANWTKLFVEGGLFSVNEISFTFISIVSLFTYLFDVSLL